MSKRIVRERGLKAEEGSKLRRNAVAAEMKLHPKYLGRILRGEVDATDPNLQFLANRYHKNPLWLIGESDAEQGSPAEVA